MWVQRRQDVTYLRSQLAQKEAQLAAMEAQLDAIKYGGDANKIEAAKATLVASFFEYVFPHLETCVVHITNVRPADLWTFKSTSPGNENKTVRALQLC
jgi:hypothetical protein